MCNGRNLAVGDEIFTEDNVYHGPASPWVGPGPCGVKQLIGTYHRGFRTPVGPWKRPSWPAIASSFGRAARDTQDGPLYAIGATGRSVTVAGIWIFRVVGMMQQLGLVSEPAGAATN